MTYPPVGGGVLRGTTRPVEAGRRHQEGRAQAGPGHQAHGVEAQAARRHRHPARRAEAAHLRTQRVTHPPAHQRPRNQPRRRRRSQRRCSRRGRPGCPRGRRVGVRGPADHRHRRPERPPVPRRLPADPDPAHPPRVEALQGDRRPRLRRDRVRQAPRHRGARQRGPTAQDRRRVRRRLGVGPRRGASRPRGAAPAHRIGRGDRGERRVDHRRAGRRLPGAVRVGGDPDGARRVAASGVGRRRHPRRGRRPHPRRGHQQHQ